MSGLRLWFAARSGREKRLILVMLALAVLVLLWAGIVLPVTDGLASAREREGDAAIRLAETEARVEAIAALGRARAPSLGQGLDPTVRARAEEAGFAVSTLNLVGPDRVQLGITAARPGALVAWLATLERQGLLVESLQMTGNDDRSVAATLTLRVRRG